MFYPLVFITFNQSLLDDPLVQYPCTPSGMAVSQNAMGYVSDTVFVNEISYGIGYGVGYGISSGSDYVAMYLTLSFTMEFTSILTIVTCRCPSLQIHHSSFSVNS